MWQEHEQGSQRHLGPSSRLAAINMGENCGTVPPFWGAELGPRLTQCRLVEAYLPTKWRLDPSSHLTTTDMGRKLGRGLCPLGGGRAGFSSNTMWPGTRPIYLHAMFHLDPSNRLATIHQRYRQDIETDRTDRQRSDGIGRTVI